MFAAQLNGSGSQTLTSPVYLYIAKRSGIRITKSGSRALTSKFRHMASMSRGGLAPALALTHTRMHTHTHTHTRTRTRTRIRTHSHSHTHIAKSNYKGLHLSPYLSLTPSLLLLSALYFLSLFYTLHTPYSLSLALSLSYLSIIIIESS